MLKKQDIAAAVEELAAIPYFPQSAGAKVAIGAHIGKFVSDSKKLRWLIDSAIVAMGEWRGIPELRGLYCTRYKPADGVEGICTLAGYSPEELEMAPAYRPAIGAVDQKLLSASEETEMIEEALGAPGIIAQTAALKQLPKPTAADRKYSKELLGHLL